MWVGLFPRVQVWDAARVLIKAAEPLTTSDTKTVAEWTRQMATLPQASKLATRILLLTLLFEVSYLHNLSEIIYYSKVEQILFFHYGRGLFQTRFIPQCWSLTDLSVCSALFPDRS